MTNSVQLMAWEKIESLTQHIELLENKRIGV